MAGFAATIVVALAACHHAPAEQQVRAAIAAAESAAEAADAGKFAQFLSDDFDGNGGAFDARRIVNMVRFARLRHERVAVVVGPVSVASRGDRLVADFTATLGGGGRVLPERLGVYQVETAWREEAGTWRCYQATWKRKL